MSGTGWTGAEVRHFAHLWEKTTVPKRDIPAHMAEKGYPRRGIASMNAQAGRHGLKRPAECWSEAARKAALRQPEAWTPMETSEFTGQWEGNGVHAIEMPRVMKAKGYRARTPRAYQHKASLLRLGRPKWFTDALLEKQRAWGRNGGRPAK